MLLRPAMIGRKSGVAAAPVTPTSLSSTDKGANISVSGNTATKGSAAAWQSGRSVASRTSGKLYCEGKPLATSGGFCMFGVAPSTTSVANFTGADANSYGYQSSGAVWNNSSSTSSTTYAVNDVIGMAIDLGLRKLWYFKNGVLLTAGDPAAGTGGLTLPAAIAMYVAYSLYTTGDQISLNFGASAFSFAPPSGFSSGFGT